MKKFCGIRANIYAYLLVDDSGHKKAKGITKCVIKRKTMLKIMQIACLMIRSY